MAPTRSKSEFLQQFAAALEQLQPICRVLPEAVEQDAWVGVRWRVGGRTFAHLLDIRDGRPAGYARAAGTSGPAIVLMFRSGGDELEVLRRVGEPFFAPVWRQDEVGLLIFPTTDWVEVAELVRESFLIQAPRRLRARLAD